MSKRSLLKEAISAVKSNKPLILSDHQPFTPPESGPDESKGGNLPQGKQPHGKVPPGNLPQGENQLPRNVSESPKPEPDLCGSTSCEFDYGKHQEERAKKRKNSMVNEAHKVHFQLTQASQKCLLEQYQASGWGRLAHCLTRHLKAPGRHGLKLVDIAVILTIYDCTLALVEPKVFAPIDVDEFEESTGMDEKNLRTALRSLVEKKALHKITWKSVNFWAINLGYFLTYGHMSTPGKQPQGNLPPGNLPQGNAPRDKKGNLPGVEGGQTTPPNDALSPRNYSNISSYKNLFEESDKESLSCDFNFPDDLVLRWKQFEKSGKFANTKKEREIFQNLFLNHGEQVFNYCGKVLTFLENQGTGKAGEEGKIHSPMVWIDGHWELNFNRYQTWISKQQALRELEAKKAEQEALKRIQAQEQAQAQDSERETQERVQAKLETDTIRFLGVYSTENEVNAFVEQAVLLSGCQLTWNSWKRLGWESPIVKGCVISHFLKTESAEVGGTSTQTPLKLLEATA